MCFDIEQRDKVKTLYRSRHNSLVRAMAVPVRDPADRAKAALSLNGPSFAPVWNDFPSLLAQVQSAAREMSRALQQSPFVREFESLLAKSTVRARIEK